MDTNELTVTAMKGLTASLQKFQNVLSIPHKKTLYSMLEGFSKMAAGQLTGRYAWDPRQVLASHAQSLNEPPLCISYSFRTH